MAGPIQGIHNIDWLTFGESHDSLWEIDPPSIGLTAPQAADYTASVADARANYVAMIAARNAAKAATQTWYASALSMRDRGSVLLALIKAFADTQPEPGAVYALAQIPQTSQRTMTGPPIDGKNLTLGLTNQGNVRLEWEGRLSKGQFFTIWRQLPGESDFTQIGSVAAKHFLDKQVPQGSQWAQYQVRAHRRDLVSEGCEPVSILFGAQLAA